MKILVAYDPPYSNTAILDRAILDAKAYNARVYLVTSFLNGQVATSEVVEKAKTELEKAQSIMAKNGVFSEIHILVRNLPPGEDIVLFALENDMDEIIVHAKKISKVGKVITGSNAQHIILKAHCTVLTVK